MSTPIEQAPGSSAAPPSDREVVVERVFNAPRHVVWQAFTEPELLAKWWGRGNTLVIETLELRRGGRWRFVEHADDGVHGFEGLYREVTPPERVVWTFAWDGMAGHTVLDAMLGFGMQKGRDQSYAALDRLLADAAGTAAGQIGSTQHGGEDV